MSAIVFLGPTLPAEAARQIVKATYLPPVQQGDVLRALDTHNPDVIGIIDGYFHGVPAVWHKEILYALENGVRVLGAASMGALRAAELYAFGMLGVGKVFEWFRDGVIEDDDEVAVAHGLEEDGYRPMSVAMVDIRHALGEAVKAGRLEALGAAELTALAKQRHYRERSWEQLRTDARAAGVEETLLNRLDEHRRRTARGLKARDAVALLRQVKDLGQAGPPLRPGWRLEHTVFFERLRAESTAGRKPPVDAFDPAHARLLVALARREAVRAGVVVSAEDVQAAANDFRRRHGLEAAHDAFHWMAQAGIDEGKFTALAYDLAVIAAIERRVLGETLTSEQ
jgi:hypothetical protein